MGCITKYFVFEPEQVIDYKSVMISSKKFPISYFDDDIVAAAILHEEVEAALFDRPVEEITQLTPTFSLTGRVIGTLLDGRKIVHAIVPEVISVKLSKYSVEEEKYTEKWLKEIGIDKDFIGDTREEVLVMFPELLGSIELHNWSCQDVMQDYTEEEKVNQLEVEI